MAFSPPPTGFSRVCSATNALKNLGPIEALVPEQQLPELRRRFDRVLATKEFDVHDLDAARAYVAAYVGFFHLAEGEEHAHEHAHAAGAQHHGHH